MALSWDDATMSSGFPEIDRQHKELIRRLDSFIEAMKAGKSQHELGELISFVGEYARSHFAHEEGCMNRVACPVAAANKNAHQRFIQIFKELSTNIERDGPKVTLILRVQRELADWIREHIVRVDTHLRNCVGARA